MTASDNSNPGGTPRAVPVEPQSSHREEVIQREKENFGGVKIGSAFFGWLTATGMAVLLTALVAGAGAAIGLGVAGNVGEASDAASENAETVGIVGAIALILIMLVAYYCGGYVAGRMARFNGAKQGLAVFVWALVIAIVVAILAAIGGANFNILANINGFPRIPINEGDLTTASVITAILTALACLAGAVLGGIAGMRFHRKVDRVGLGR
ncbi:MAG: hypothetical protein JWP30_1040 [Homoserinimonas sp.]|jgi:hypothetical protein|nr:hypothetical protein [Homoserinimonas sp.]